MGCGDNDALLAVVVLNFDNKALAARLALAYLQERSSSGFKVHHDLGSLLSGASSGNLLYVLTTNSHTGFVTASSYAKVRRDLPPTNRRQLRPRTQPVLFLRAALETNSASDRAPNQAGKLWFRETHCWPLVQRGSKPPR